MTCLKEIRPVLTVGISLIFLVALASNASKDLAETDFALLQCVFESIDQESPVDCDDDNGDALDPALFSISPKLQMGFLRNGLSFLPDKVSLCQKNPVLRC